MNRLFNTLLCGLMLACSTAGQAQDIDLYRADVAVVDQSESARRGALADALTQVIVRITGDQHVTREPGLAAALNQAERMLLSFAYRSTMELDPQSGQTLRQFRLIANFDPAGVQQLLRENALPFWGSERPAVVTWLFIEDQRLVTMATDRDDPRLQALRTRAEERGVPLLFPLMDLEDQQSVDSGTVWRGDVRGISRANERYGTPLALVGRLSAGDQGNARWNAVGADIEDSWTVSGTWDEMLQGGIDGLAQRLGQRYAILPGEQVSSQLRVVVSGIESASDFARVSAYLNGLSVVSEVNPEHVSGQRLILRLSLQAGANRLRQQIALGDVLVPEAAAADGSEQYRLLP